MTREASTVYLRKVATNESVVAELWDGIGPQNLADWTREWQPVLMRALQELVSRGVPMQHWPQSWHWNWETKVAHMSGLLGARTFCVVAESVTQGLMSVDLTKNARLEVQRAKPIVYVDYLEVAPWNRKDLVGSARFRGIGTVLIAAAIELSRQEDFKGRIGLHSLPQADDFYRNTCKMSDLQPDPAKQNLRYFEMTRDQAEAFMVDENRR
jgi:hypothetical protein